MTWLKSPPQLIALFDSAVPRDPRVERRKMFGYPAAFTGGKLFASLFQESVILKLSAQDREQLQSAHGAVPFEPTAGRRMKEYMRLPDGMQADRAMLEAWLSRALAYVAAQAKAASKSKASTGRRKTTTAARTAVAK